MKILIGLVVMGVLFSACSWVGASVPSATPFYGDAIRLSTGEIITGELLRFDGNTFVIKTATGIVEKQRREVIGILIGSKPAVTTGVLSQWASQAKASSQYTNARWSAQQATGEPNTTKCGDLDTAWAPVTNGEGPEWLELAFDTPVYATGLRVHETYNSGCIYQVELVDAKGKHYIIWQGRDTTTCPGWFKLSFKPTAYLVQSVVLYTQIKGWEEIDAVELTGLVEVSPETWESTKAEPTPEEKEQEQEHILTVTVRVVLRNKEVIGAQKIQVRGWAKNIEHNEGLLGGKFTNFLLTDDQGNSLKVHLDRKVTNIPQDREVIVTGGFEKLLGVLTEYFSATNITWQQ